MTPARPFSGSRRGRSRRTGRTSRLGGTLILTGLGLATWFVLLMILQELTTRDARAQRDLSA